MIPGFEDLATSVCRDHQANEEVVRPCSGSLSSPFLEAAHGGIPVS